MSHGPQRKANIIQMSVGGPETAASDSQISAADYHKLAGSALSSRPEQPALTVS